jgi:hypothetical protein
MLTHLRTASARKLRLFACACCRRIWRLLTDERSRQAVEAAEQWADGLLGPKELKVVQKAAAAAARKHFSGADYYATQAASEVATPRKEWVVHTAWCCRYALGGKRLEEERVQCDLLRDIFGIPWRPVSVDPSWLVCQDGAVRRLAQSIYDERVFDRLPILADALEDAGCDSADLLAHCRGPGPHVRGCWVIDALLGKQ